MITADVTYVIPTHYPTLQAAFEDLAPQPKKPGVTVTLEWAAGHVPTSGVTLTGGDYSQFRITSATASPGADANGIARAQVTLNASFPTGVPLLKLTRAIGPVWDVLVDMNGFGGKGIEALECSTVFVNWGKGVLRATGAIGSSDGTPALYMSDGSTGMARGSLWAYSGRGIWVARASQLEAEMAVCDYCTDIGVYASRSSNVSFNGGKARYITYDPVAVPARAGIGVCSNRSFVTSKSDYAWPDPQASMVNGCDRGYMVQSGGVIDCSGGYAADCTQAGVYADGGQAYANATLAATTKPGAYGYKATSGGVIQRVGGTGTMNIPRNATPNASGIIMSNVA